MFLTEQLQFSNSTVGVREKAKNEVSYLSLYLCIYLLVYPSIYLSIYRSLRLSICLSTCLGINFSIWLSIYPSICQDRYFSIGLPDAPNSTILSPSVCLSVSHFSIMKYYRFLQSMDEQRSSSVYKRASIWRCQQNHNDSKTAGDPFLPSSTPSPYSLLLLSMSGSCRTCYCCC